MLTPSSNRPQGVVVFVPVPDKDIVGEFEAVVVNPRFPVALPLAVGAKTIESVALCPAASVVGKLNPLAEYSLPVTVIDDTVTLPPDAVRVADIVPLLPTATLPKESDVGVTFRVVGNATPVPLNETKVGLLDALLTKETCPEALLADVGANLAV